MDLDGLAEAALREFKKLHCNKYKECEFLMQKNRWVSWQLAEYRLLIMSCMWKRVTSRGWGPHLDRLTRDRYLTRLQQVRLEVMKGMLCIIKLIGLITRLLREQSP